jgi:hypothetical protein
MAKQSKFRVKVADAEYDLLTAHHYGVDDGCLGFFATDDEGTSLFITYSRNGWLRVSQEGEADETIPSDSPKEAPQG